MGVNGVDNVWEKTGNLFFCRLGSILPSGGLFPHTSEGWRDFYHQRTTISFCRWFRRLHSRGSRVHLLLVLRRTRQVSLSRHLIHVMIVGCGDGWKWILKLLYSRNILQTSRPGNPDDVRPGGIWKMCNWRVNSPKNIRTVNASQLSATSCPYQRKALHLGI